MSQGLISRTQCFRKHFLESRRQGRPFSHLSGNPSAGGGHGLQPKSVLYQTGLSVPVSHSINQAYKIKSVIVLRFGHVNGNQNCFYQILKNIYASYLCFFCDVSPKAKIAASCHQHTNTLSQRCWWSRDKTRASFLENTLQKADILLTRLALPPVPLKLFFFFF